MPSFDPFSAQSWSRPFGLVSVPMFGAARGVSGQHFVMLDGPRASFALSFGPTEILLSGHEPLSWAWSSNLRRLVVPDERTGRMYVRRWRLPNVLEKQSIPRTEADAEAVLAAFEAEDKPRSADVIVRLLQAFKVLRSNVSPFSTDAIDVVRHFNAFLKVSERIHKESITEGEWRNLRTTGDVLSLLPAELSAMAGDLEHLASAPTGPLLELFVDPEPTTNCRLDPDLFICHASGQLYQEAHFELERYARQATLFPVLSATRNAGTLQRDARFTPPELARLMAENSFQAIGELPANLRIIDPACGSGVFLCAAIRELVRLGFRGHLTLAGFDTSIVSVEIARFCLDHISADARRCGIDVHIDIKNENALVADWGHPNIVLMNPPFVSWRGMDASDRELVRAELSNLFLGQVDKSIAFLMRATKQLAANGVVATVLPSPLLGSSHGVRWRQAISERFALHTIGRFAGFGFFPGAMVEPGFLVAKSGVATTNRSTTFGFAAPGFEQRAIRAIRRHLSDPTAICISDDISISDVPATAILPESWMPRSRRFATILDALANANLPRVRDVFTVHQGALTGSNTVFVVTRSEYKQLESSEQACFRPAAGTTTIRGGCIQYTEYVFYPYKDDGSSRFESEEELEREAPWFFRERLRPNKAELELRVLISPRKYWEMVRPRAWQFKSVPKLVSAYFGYSGSFAYDSTGKFLVVHGYAWLPNAESIMLDGDEDAALQFYETPLPWTYLAILNSPIFESLLACFCPRVQGGQFNLSKRFVDNVFLPDFLDPDRVSGDTVAALERAGRRIAQGKMQPPVKVLRELAAAAYGLPWDVWESL